MTPAELRQRRLALGLSQAHLAAALGVAGNTVARWERGERPLCRTELLRLGLERLEEAARPAQPARSAEPSAPGAPRVVLTVDRPRHNLSSELSSFVGREQQLAELVQVLSTTRLLTLVGTGGVGKTRLGVRLATLVLEAYPHGVWLVDLAPLTDPALVPQAVALVLGVRERARRPLLETLIGTLRPKRLLLVLDNCEHLVAACAELASALLCACSDLRILATSREPLRAIGETTWRVPSLAVPQPGLFGQEELSQYESIRLFVARARAAQPDFALTDENARTVSEVCRRLDGIPLALELAAALVPMLGPTGVAARLDDRFRLLTRGTRGAPARQQTLRATLEWSYELLSEPERLLFDRLSVFAGGWTLEAAERVCAGDGIESQQVLDLLTHLVDKSLVVAEPAAQGTVRYRLLETLRQHGQERLAGLSPADVIIRGRHAAFFRDLAERTEPESWGAGYAAWWARMEAEIDNFRTALRWLIDRADSAAAQRLGGALARFLQTRSYLEEGRAWMAELLALPGGAAPTGVRARVLLGAGLLDKFHGEYAAGQSTLEQAIAICRERGDQETIGFALFHLAELLWWRRDHAGAVAAAKEGVAVSRAAGLRTQEALSLYVLGGVAYDQGDFGAARTWAEQALNIYLSTGYPRGIAAAWQTLARISFQCGDLASAQRLLELGFPLFQESAWPWGTAWNLATLGWVATDQGDLPRARAYLSESLAIWRELGVRVRVVEVVEGFAQLAVAEGQPDRALRLAGAAAAQREALGTPLSRTEERQLRPRLERARRVLGPASAAAAWATGRATSLEDAVAEALAPPSAQRKPPPTGDQAGPLTAREREVIARIARGLTNRQIAAELVVSERTVDSHVEHVRTKLGLRSRAHIAAWAGAHGLAAADTD